MPGKKVGVSEMTDGRTIWHAPHADHREVHLRILHGLAHCLLITNGEAHTEGDAWALTLAMAAHDEDRAPAWLFEFMTASAQVA